MEVEEVADDIVMFFREYPCDILSLLLDEIDAFLLGEGADVPQELVVGFLDLLHLFIDDQLDILADHAIAKGARKA